MIYSLTLKLPFAQSTAEPRGLRFKAHQIADKRLPTGIKGWQ